LHNGFALVLFVQTHSVLKSILTASQIDITLQRLAHQIFEQHPQLSNTVIIGLQPRGIYVSDKMVQLLHGMLPSAEKVPYGKLDITFYRDDVRKQIHIPNHTNINFSIENKNVVLIDDVLWTGRTIRAAFDALLDFGRPAKVELCVLIDRRFSREFPIMPTYIGRTIDTQPNQKVLVRWPNEQEGAVWLADGTE